MSSQPPLVEFRNVTVCRGDHVALNRVSLSVALGEHLAILGPNGSGKSTLIKTITRECYPVQSSDSSVRLLGQELWNVFDLRVLLGIVSNDLIAACRWAVTGRELILSGFFSSIGIWPNHRVTDAMEETARGVMAKLDVAHLAERSVHQMSSGELRRVLIGRALVHEPKALVLDEPTSSLDVRARAELHAALGRLAAAGTSIIMVTHHLADILPVINRVILVQQGQVIDDGPKRRLLTSAHLSALFDTPVRVARRNGHYYMT